MKLLGGQKKVIYFGIELMVPDYTKYLAVDEDGRLHGYKGDVVYIGGIEFYGSYSDDFFIGIVDLEGMNWKETLVEV
jgi:hypothetical protein